MSHQNTYVSAFDRYDRERGGMSCTEKAAYHRSWKDCLSYVGETLGLPPGTAERVMNDINESDHLAGRPVVVEGK